MKTNNQLVISITILLLFTSENLNAQVSTPANAGFVGNFVGWELNELKDLDIVNEDVFPIKFYTSGGPGSGGIWNHLRMIIAGNGNVRVGNNTTPLSLFHLHQSAASTSTLFHITNAGTGTASNNGFDIRQEYAGEVYFNQRELEFVRFQSLSSDDVAGGAIFNS